MPPKRKPSTELLNTPCPDRNKIRNPKTGICVSREGKIGKKVLEELEQLERQRRAGERKSPERKSSERKSKSPKRKSPERKSSERKSRERKSPERKSREKGRRKPSTALLNTPCPDRNKIRNPKTGICVSREGKIGKKVLEELEQLDRQRRAGERKSPERKSIERKSKSPKRKSPERKSRERKSKSPKRKSPERKSRERKSPERKSRERKSGERKSYYKEIGCKNDTDIIGLESLEDISKKKLFKSRNGYCYDIDNVIEFLISNENKNQDPQDPSKKLWESNDELKEIIFHKGISTDTRKRYGKMKKNLVKKMDKLENFFTLDQKQINFINNIAQIGIVFYNLGYKDITKGISKFEKELNKNKEWLKINIQGTLKTIMESVENTCNHLIGITFLRYYAYLYSLITNKYKKSLELSPYFLKVNDYEYITFQKGQQIDYAGKEKEIDIDDSIKIIHISTNIDTIDYNVFKLSKNGYVKPSSFNKTIYDNIFGKYPDKKKLYKYFNERYLDSKKLLF
jgi:hypothetical protein